MLQVTCSGMEAQDTHEDILVVGQVGHSLDVLNIGIVIMIQVSDHEGTYQYIPVHTSTYHFQLVHTSTY